MGKNLKILLIFLVLLISIAIYFCGASGVVMHLRLWRFILILTVAFSLSTAGLILQNVLRNPLVEPYIIGISSTGALGYVLGLVMGIPSPYDGLFTIGGVIAGFLPVYMMGKSPLKFILSGVAVGLFSSSILSLLMAINHQDILKTFYILWGNVDRIFSDVDIIILSVSAMVVIALIAITFLLRKPLQIISLPEEEARSLGLDVPHYMRIFILIAFLLTGISIYLAGVIGFVGLVVPHMARMLFSDRMGSILFSSLVISAVLLLLSDAFIRLVLPVSLPIGIITSIIGVPFFIYLLGKW